MDGSINSIINAKITTPERSNNGLNAKIVKITKTLENNDKPQKLSGDVVRKINESELQIRTDKGDITVKTDNTNLKIENGDKIELIINKGHPPTSAIISLAPKLMQNKVSAPEITLNKLNINLPPKLSVPEILSGAPINVELINTDITQTYIENINSNLNLVANLPIVINESPPLENLLIANKSEISSPILGLLKLPVMDSNTAQIIDFISVETPTTKIPLNIIMVGVISNPNISPINIDKISLETPPPSIFSEIKISNITQPIIDITGFTEDNIRAGEIIVELVGFTNNKHLPIVKTMASENHEIQYYALQTPIEDIPIGSGLKINISDIKTINQNSTLVNTNPIITSAASLLTPDIWTVMQDIQNTLNIAHTQIAASFNNIIPNPAKPSMLAPSALFFIAAMRSGDLQSWLGERIFDTLKRTGKPDLLTRLSGDISNISRVNNNIGTQEWRSFPLPLAWQNEIYKAVIHYHKESNENADNEGNSSVKTRFVMDLNLSKIGETQLDGLFISNKRDEGRLDLILRTKSSFSQAIKQEMRNIYTNALKENNYSGELSFQGENDKWVKITLNTKPEFSKKI